MLLPSCVDPIANEDFDNPFDPDNPESVFNQTVEATAGIGELEANGATVELDVSWTPVEEATEYEVLWSTSENFSDTNSISAITGDSSSFDVPNDTTVYWQVRYEATLTGHTEPVSAWSDWFGPWEVILSRTDSDDTTDDDQVDQLSPPSFSPSGGTYDSNQTVEISSENSEADIYYTTDGTDPTTNSTEYTGPISVAGDGTNITIRAIAVRDGFADSTVAEASYTIAYDRVSTPQFTPAGGTYTSDQSVEITSSTPGATIYYTTDGSEPDTNSDIYTGPIQVSEGTSVSIRAFATLEGYLDSPRVTADYTVDSPPTVSNFFAQATTNAVTLTWDETPSLLHDHTQIAFGVRGEPLDIFSGTVDPAGTQIQVPNGSTYVFEVKAIATNGEESAPVYTVATPGDAGIEGLVSLESTGNVQDAVIALTLNGSSANLVSITRPDTNGRYAFAVPELQNDDRYSASAFMEGYGTESYFRYYTADEVVDNTVFVDPDPVLLVRPRQVTLRVKYQPDGTTDMRSGVESTEQIVLRSRYHRPSAVYVGDRGTLWFIVNDSASGEHGFEVATTAYAGGFGDVYFSFASGDGGTFWANNGSGGLTDLGVVSVDAVDNVPQKDDVDPGRVYTPFGVPVVVGNSYGVLTTDRSNYGVIEVTDLSLYSPNISGE